MSNPEIFLKAIPGVEFVEMKRNRANSFCCGGGGGVMTGFGEWADQECELKDPGGSGHWSRKDGIYMSLLSFQPQ